ncbi:MAG: DUF2062 domain-containing protein [Akkermansia sp.]
MRKVKRYLLLERRKKSMMGRYLKVEIFNEEYWGWNRHSVTVGATWGSVCAILPVPMQTFWGIGCCLWKKGNIPVSVLMAWLSPPGFLVVATPAQWWVGWFILSFLGFPGSGASVEMLQKALQTTSMTPLHGLNYWMFGAEFGLGLVLTCLAMFFFSWSLVQIIWLLGGFPPKASKASKQ